MLTPSEANKIKKGILAASEVAKCRICRKVIETLRIYRLHYYTDEQVNHFLDLCQKTDFEAATTYYVNTMLAGFKKKEPILYQSDLVSRSADLVMVHDINPNSKDVIDKALSTSNYAGILKALHAYMKKASLLGAIDNILYLTWELARRPKDDVPVSVKHCTFHLLAQFIASRKNGKMAEYYTTDTLIYLQDKYHFFDLSNPKEMSVYQGTVRQNDFKPEWQQFFNPDGSSCSTARLTISDIHQMMDNMDAAHADLVHYLFMGNYIDFSHYNFRDEWMIDRYVEEYNAYFQEDPGYLKSLNDYVVAILQEWKQYNYKLYLKARKDLLFWMSDPIPAFKPTLGDAIHNAYIHSIEREDALALVESLLPFPMQVVNQVKEGHFEDAAANIYCLFEHLSTANQLHEDWFKSYWTGGEIHPIVLYLELLSHIYCYLRQLSSLPKGLANEMDCHLDILNKKTSLFGDGLPGDSRYDDMFATHGKQYNDYSVIENDYLWEWYLNKYKVTS